MLLLLTPFLASAIYIGNAVGFLLVIIAVALTANKHKQKNKTKSS
jgi:uncharacterized membrane protein